MRPLLIGLIALGLSLPLSAQKQSSKIETITVYSGNAQITRSAKVQLKKGENELIFTGLSTMIDANSIRVRANSTTLVRQVEYVTEYIEEGGDPSKVKQLGEKLQAEKARIRKLDSKMAGIQKELDFLNQNTQLGGSRNATFNLQTFQQTSQFFRTRTESLLNEHQEIKEEKKDVAERINVIFGEIIKARSSSTERIGEIHVKLDAEIAGPLTLEFDYLVNQAGWTPQYELRVDEVGKPIELELKADLINATDVDWNKVDLVFSTGDPQRGTTVPPIGPWYITQPIYYQNPAASKVAPKQERGKTGKFYGTVIDQSSREPIPSAVVSFFKENGELIANSLTDFDGYFSFVANDPVASIQVISLGYQKWSVSYPGPGNLNVQLQAQTQLLQEVTIIADKPYVEKGKTSMMVTHDEVNMIPPRSMESSNTQYIDGVKVRGTVTINANELNAGYNSPIRSIAQRFSAKKPTTVKGDGSKISISLLSFELDAEYEYQAVPKFDPEGFLQAKIVGWDTLGLINGRMNVFVEGSFVGATNLDVQQPQDTLALSLGRDPNVVFKRTALPAKKEKSFFGGKITETALFEIEMKNSKRVPITVIVKDQFPLSPSEDIKIERLESSGGKVDEKTGIITWEIILQPGEQTKRSFGFEVTYPKEKRIYF